MSTDLRRLATLAAALLLPLAAQADFDEDYESKKWQELELTLPTAPQEANLQPLEVSAATSNRFFIDTASLSVGSDGVVRYTLLIVTPQGVRNVSYEGMRCETRERRIYATGRSDGSWAKSRNNDWRRIQEEYTNRYHAELYLNYFCPIGSIVNSREEALEALRRGGHSSLRNLWK